MNRSQQFFFCPKIILFGISAKDNWTRRCTSSSIIIISTSSYISKKRTSLSLLLFLLLLLIFSIRCPVICCQYNSAHMWSRILSRKLPLRPMNRIFILSGVRELKKLLLLVSNFWGQTTRRTSHRTECNIIIDVDDIDEDRLSHFLQKRRSRGWLLFRCLLRRYAFVHCWTRE